MDGMHDPGTDWTRRAPAQADVATLTLRDAAPALQHTLATSIDCTGIALHSGRVARVALHAAPPDTGIVFARTDLACAEISARHHNVVDTRLCTAVGTQDWRIGTIEHLMAALAGAEIDNARIEVDGPELPILDGSAAAFLFLIDCAGREAQSVPRRRIDILRPVRVEQAEAWAELRPHAAAGQPGLDLDMTIDFPATAIGPPIRVRAPHPRQLPHRTRRSPHLHSRQRSCPPA